jgi:hypothetical protein
MARKKTAKAIRAEKLRAHNRKVKVYQNLSKALDAYMPYVTKNPPTPDKITLAILCKQLQCCLVELDV